MLGSLLGGTRRVAAAVGGPGAPCEEAGPVLRRHRGPGGGVAMSVLDRSIRFVDDLSGVGVARRRSWERRYARLLLSYDAVVGIVAAMSAYLLRFPSDSLSWAYVYALATFAAPLLWTA